MNTRQQSAEILFIEPRHQFCEIVESEALRPSRDALFASALRLTSHLPAYVRDVPYTLAKLVRGYLSFPPFIMAASCRVFWRTKDKNKTTKVVF
ncbi:MAG: hypothetical protein HYT98_01740 [Candidatus Sungbacteria bacterium]|nr:hypothetical protein [Candidatus Sungbacteria bacterium]